MYAVTAPGLACVLEKWIEVESIIKLYPFPNWFQGRTEHECVQWLKEHRCERRFTGFSKYGNTYKHMYLKAKYKIVDGTVFIEIDCSRVGRIRPTLPNVLYEYKGSKLFVKIPNLKLSDTAVNSHMLALYYILKMVGPHIDVDLELPYYGVYYAVKYANDNKNRNIRNLRDTIQQRLGSVSYTLPLLSCLPEEVEEKNEGDMIWTRR